MSRNLSKALLPVILCSVIICLPLSNANAGKYERMTTKLEQMEQRLATLETSQT